MKKDDSTIKQRKKGILQATQRFLPLAEIRNDTVLLKNGGMRAVLEVEAINFNLKSEGEQQAIIAGYGGFVNTLAFPIEISVRSTKTNIDEYLAKIQEMGNKQENDLLKEQTLDYVNFMRRLLDVADIMQKKFYCIVPVDVSLRKKTMIEKLFDWMSPDDTKSKSAFRSREFLRGLKDLNERVDLVQSGLENIGLKTKRLNTRDLLSLYYQIYNPLTSNVQKIPANMDQLNTDETVL